MSKEDNHFRLRMPEDMKEWIKIRSANNMRSMTAEIVFILKERMEKEKAGPPTTA